MHATLARDAILGFRDLRPDAVRMIALEVSSAAGKPPFGGIGGCIRNIVSELLPLDPQLEYVLCARLSRWRKGNLFTPDARNARSRPIQDPFNRWLLPRARLFHSMGAFLPRTPRIPKIATVHDLNAVRNPKWCSPEWHRKRSARFREVIELADHIVTPSRFMADEVIAEYGLDPARIHAIPHGVDSSRFHPASDAVKRRMRERYGDYVLSIGLLTPRKNFTRLAQAMSELGALNWVLVGRPSDGSAELESAVSELGLSPRFIHLPSLPESELIELMGSARAFAVPSLYEGFGLTALEALACGVPVVCSSAASLPEVVGDAALLVDATRPKEIAEAFERILADPHLAAHLAHAGRERALSMPWRLSAERHLELYRNVLAG